MPPVIRFCQGCNEKHACEDDRAPCPVCGQALSGLDDAPTARIFVTARGDVDGDGDEHPAGAAGEKLAGRRFAFYDVERFIGKGGMARVYSATHAMLERPCAIKVLDPRLAQNDPDYVAMFHEEARSAAALVHPHIVTVHNVGEAEGLHFIEMELVAGQSLERAIAATGPIEPIRATELMVQVVSGLAEAHRAGVVHRDVKPANVLMTRDGTAKLADFGLAKRIHSRKSALSSGILVGTPYYMAPELFYRQPASTASDVYAAGVMFYHLLTAELPFVDTDLTHIARKHATEPPPDGVERGSGIPEEAFVLIRRCLAKDRSERYSDAGELLLGLRALYGNLRGMPSLLREAFSGLGLRWSGRDNRFLVRVRLDDGRSQRVWVEASDGGRLADRLVKIYSVCAPVEEAYARRALELNAEIPHGSIAIQEIEGIPHFIMIDTYPRASCDPVEVRKSVLQIARWADHVEKVLTGGDRN